MDGRRFGILGALALLGGCTTTDAIDAAMPDLTVVKPPDMVVVKDFFGECFSDSDCVGMGGTCCNRTCRDLKHDTANCGGCNVACPGGNTCCEGRCANTSGDPMHCGGCDTVCQVTHGKPGCNAGACTVVGCDTGFGDCNQMVGDGCETATSSTLEHCGGCGAACAPTNATGACQGGVCGLGMCKDGFADCNNDNVDGCEIVTSTDPDNCGGCGVPCLMRTNAVPLCKGGECTIKSCVGNFLDCDQFAGNGCEANSRIDGLNCGACGVRCGPGLQCVNGACTCLPCALPNARSSCQNLKCTIDSCVVGFSDCDMNPINGCEATLKTDPRNCGGCGVVCAGQTPYCLLGTCVGVNTTCAGILQGNAQAKSGVYVIDPDGNGGVSPFPAYCDMTTSGGGWTMVLNLDTSDGNVMWWGNGSWEDNAEVGEVLQPFDGDHKSPAWTAYSGTQEILLVVHEQGTYRGWKRFRKVDGRTMFQYFADNKDNTLLGNQVTAQDTAGISFAGERLVRLSSQLYVNHCVQNGGNCTSGAAGSPDGDRIGSNEGTPSDNNGGGLGNWHDMRYCCPQYGTPASGKVCIGGGSTFRTTSEAQAGWASCYNGQAGAFGTDSFVPWTFSCTDQRCDGANWAGPSNVNYDYAILLR